MMMAHDSSVPPRGRFSDAALERVQHALAGYIRRGEVDGELREALRALAAEARAGEIAPEQVLITLKQAWHELPSGAHPRNGVDDARLLQRIVTVCIKEYYG